MIKKNQLCKMIFVFCCLSLVLPSNSNVAALGTTDVVRSINEMKNQADLTVLEGNLNEIGLNRLIDVRFGTYDAQLKQLPLVIIIEIPRSIKTHCYGTPLKENIVSVITETQDISEGRTFFGFFGSIRQTVNYKYSIFANPSLTQRGTLSRFNPNDLERRNGELTYLLSPANISDVRNGGESLLTLTGSEPGYRKSYTENVGEYSSTVGTDDKSLDVEASYAIQITFEGLIFGPLDSFKPDQALNDLGLGALDLDLSTNQLILYGGITLGVIILFVIFIISRKRK